jgi:hypothetical protein
MVYNIYLNSPQLAYNANIKKYYRHVIKDNNKILNKRDSSYKAPYFYTSYSRIQYPYKVVTPY